MNCQPAEEEYIAVIDCGGQTAHLICRRLRDYGVFAKIVPAGGEDGLVGDPLLKGVIVSGSPSSVTSNTHLQPSPALLKLPVPLMGICYGLHWICQSLGGRVGQLTQAEYGPQPVKKTTAGSQHPLLADLPQSFTSWMSHGDSLAQLPTGFIELARSEQGFPAVVGHQKRPIVGVQFHPETSHCQGGEQVLRNFAFSLCQARVNWKVGQQLESLSWQWKQRIGEQPVVLLISGGVDSAVVAAFLLRLLAPDQLHLLHFDTGLMRAGEGDQVMESLRTLGAHQIHRLKVAPEFLGALSGVTGPEEKRRRIGNLFIDLQRKYLKDAFPGQQYLLAQGTLYTDMIESGGAAGGHSQTIKSHHNVGTPLVAELRRQQRLVEPLANLYKDEVRQLGLLLGLSEELVYRHPFPGPGLAVRILGEVTADKVALLQRIDAVFLARLSALGLYHRIWQAFAVLLPLSSVGVTGDARHYGAVVALRAVTASDGMSAQPYPFTAEELRDIVHAICNQVQEVSRVVYDVTAKPPATIEWE